MMSVLAQNLLNIFIKCKRLFKEIFVKSLGVMIKLFYNK